MSNPAFIVDGFTEQALFSRICPGRPVQRTDLNGKDVSIKAIAKKVASMIRLLGNRYYPIIILIDKESRKDSIIDLKNNLTAALCDEGVIDQDLRISFADVMIENWIIADYKLIDKVENKPPITDGLRGSAVIKRCVGSYNKMADGVDMLLKANPSVVYLNSPSFKDFVDQLIDIECDYLSFDRI